MSILNLLETARQALESAASEIESSPPMTIDECFEVGTLVKEVYYEYYNTLKAILAKMVEVAALTEEQNSSTAEEVDVDVEAISGWSGYMAVLDKYRR